MTRKQSNEGGAAAALEYLRQLRDDDLPVDDVPRADGGEADSAASLPTAGVAAEPPMGSASAWTAEALATAASYAAPAPPESGAEWVVCPECGTGASIDPAQRRSEDFCQNCDFPLFWARASVVAMAGDETGASLKRLPGTVGRAATASVACPHCGEPNSPVAQVCVRCGQPMVIVAPEPAPVYIVPEPEPEPAPEPEPEPDMSLWVVILAASIVVLIVLIAIALQ